MSLITFVSATNLMTEKKGSDEFIQFPLNLVKAAWLQFTIPPKIGDSNHLTQSDTWSHSARQINYLIQNNSNI